MHFRWISSKEPGPVSSGSTRMRSVSGDSLESAVGGDGTEKADDGDAGFSADCDGGWAIDEADPPMAYDCTEKRNGQET